MSEAKRNMLETKRNLSEAKRNLSEAKRNLSEAKRNASEAKRNASEAKQNASEPIECGVCLEQIGKTNNCVTPCGHAFCFMCMVKCLAQKNTCPMCRSSLNEIQEEDTYEIEVRDLIYKGVTYYLDDQNNVRDVDSHEIVGKYFPETNDITFDV